MEPTSAENKKLSSTPDYYEKKIPEQYTIAPTLNSGGEGVQLILMLQLHPCLKEPLVKGAFVHSIQLWAE